MAYKISDNSVIDDNRELTAVSVTPSTNLVVPYGTTANRPAGAVGKLYFDTDLGKLLVHNGTTWIESSTSGSIGGDFALHGAKYLMPPNMGADLDNNNPSYRITNYMPFNNIVQNVSWAQHGTDSWDCFVKLKTMPYEVELMGGSIHGGTGQWPNFLSNGYNGGSAGVTDGEVGKFQPHATLALDNSAVCFNTGGSGVTTTLDYRVQSWLFDSQFPNQTFFMQGPQNQGTPPPITGGYGIYKYSDTQYVTFTNTNVGAAQLEWNGSTGSFGKINLRCYNPNNVIEGQVQTSSGADPVWNKDYTCSNSYGQARGMVYGVFKSATPNRLTVMYTNSKGLNNTSYQQIGSGTPTPCIRIFDVDMNNGSVIPDATTKHLEFRPTTTNTPPGGGSASSLLPSGHSFTVCECSTHVTMITWSNDSGGVFGSGYAFWIWDKANRDLRVFRPEIYDDANFNNGSLNNNTNPNRLWMNHFKMNDKIYLATCSQGDGDPTLNSHEGVYIYETSATAATPYMQVYNNTQSNQAMNSSPSQFQSFRPLFSTSTMTFQHNLYSSSGSEVNWGGHDTSAGITSVYTSTRSFDTTALTINPQTSKTLIQNTFHQVLSGNWSSSNTITYLTNPQKQADGTSTWSDANSTGTTTEWSYNMRTRKFFGGVSS